MAPPFPYAFHRLTGHVPAACRKSGGCHFLQAILAINGDFYGSRESGYVLRNGVLYRDTPVQGQMDLVIYQDGTFGIIQEDKVTADALLASGAAQVLSFGPVLVQDGEVTVSASDEVGKAMTSNPRTAIGIIETGHYLFVVSDGRTQECRPVSTSAGGLYGCLRCKDCV